MVSAHVLLIPFESSELHLNPVDPVTAVNEQHEDKYERDLRSSVNMARHIASSSTYLHAILNFPHHRIFRNERKELSFPSVWERDNQQSKEEDLEHEDGEHLPVIILVGA